MDKLFHLKFISILCFLFFINKAFTQTGPPVASSDYDKNWTSVISYDITGVSLSKQVNFFNYLGKSTQTQSWDILTDKIWGAQSFYDGYGRLALQSLSAPIGSGFGYNSSDFILDWDDNSFTQSDFELNPEHPSQVSSNSRLGDYYGTNSDPYHDVTYYPYSRIIYSKLNPGKTHKVLGMNKVNGQWLQSYSFSMPAAEELSQPNAYNDDVYNHYKINKTVNRDVNGIETVVFTDVDGNVLGSARSGNEHGDNTTSYTNEISIGEQGWVDFHIPQGCSLSTTLLDPVSSNGTSNVVNSSGDDTSGEESNYITDIQARISSFEAKNANTSKTEQALKIEASNEFQKSEINSSSELPTGFYYRVYDLIEEDVVMQVPPGTYTLPAHGFYRAELRYGTTIYIPFVGSYHMSVGAESSQSFFNTFDYGVEHCQNYYDYSLNSYDNAGRLIESIQPKRAESASGDSSENPFLESIYKYNTLNQLLETSSPDEGSTKFKYRKDGQIRFSQNSKQALVNEVSFTDYDKQGRPVRSGVANLPQNMYASFEDLDPDNTTLSLGLKELHFTTYDKLDSGIEQMLTSHGIPPNEYKAQFLYGNVAKTRTDLPKTSTTWYSYDVYGRVEWVVQYIFHLGVQTIDYTYDPVTGNISEVDLNRHKTSERFVHRYKYNTGGQLVSVKTSTDGENFTPNARYYYNENGSLKRTELAEDLQGVDYVYNINGQLKAINSPLTDGFTDPGNDSPANNGFRPDVFGMIVDYHPDDFKRSAAYLDGLKNNNTPYQPNGNISSLRWHNNNSPNSNQVDTYRYQYNKNNWLSEAQFGTSSTQNGSVNFSPNSNGDYKVDQLTYDANGNIKSLKRNGYTDNQGSNAMDDFTYHYEANTNQLKYVEDSNDNTDATRYNDLKDQSNLQQDNYVYNDIGQLTTNIQEEIGYQYNASGLVTKINSFSDQDTGTWTYLFKEDFENATDEDALSWDTGQDNNVSAMLNYGQFNIGKGYCNTLRTTYGNNLMLRTVILATGSGNDYISATKTLKAIPGKLHRLSLDVIAKQTRHLILNTSLELPPNDNPVGYTITIEDSQGNVLGTKSFNTPNPEEIDDPDLDSQFITACELYYDQSENLEFTPNTEQINLRIDIDHDIDNSTAVYVDNIELEVASAPKVAYYYNDRGHRVRKEFYNNGNTNYSYYVRDISGNVLAIYTKKVSRFTIGEPTRTINTPQAKEHPVYGNSRLGVFYRGAKNIQGGLYAYQLTDHLGNVRAVVMKEGDNALSMTNKTDYYPFGMPMPNRNVEGNYRYGYQGEYAEKEDVGSTNSFELRLWDSRIGRWMSPDPYNQYHSPYLGMGNNPVSRIDSDGGFDSKIGAYLYRLYYGLKGAEIRETGNSVDKYSLTYSSYDKSCDCYSSNIIVGSGWELNKLDLLKKINPSISMRNSTDYIYTKEDLVKRHIVTEGRNPIGKYLKKMEDQGVFEPIGLYDWIDYYGEDTYRNYRFFEGFRLGFELTGIGVKAKAATIKKSPNQFKYKTPTTKQIKAKMTTDIVPYKVHVKGHFKTSKLGNKFYVQPYTRNLPNQ